jgi:hypothetical protein
MGHDRVRNPSRLHKSLRKHEPDRTKERKVPSTDSVTKRSNRKIGRVTYTTSVKSYKIFIYEAKRCLHQTVRIIDDTSNAWRFCIERLAQTIRSCRSDLAGKTNLPAELTDEESQCFKDCLRIIAQALAAPTIGLEPLSPLHHSDAAMVRGMSTRHVAVTQ